MPRKSLAVNEEAYATACQMAAGGWSVFPCHGVIETSDSQAPFACACGKPDCGSPGKHPLTAHGCKDASTDLEQLERWRRRWPGANWALATGEAIVIDVDGAKGVASLRRLEKQHRPLPHSWRVATGREQSRHFYFSAPRGAQITNSAGALGAGLDVRGVGGYVVLPGSRHICGHSYAWFESWHPKTRPLAPCPRWLLEILTAPQAAPRRGPYSLSAAAAPLPYQPRYDYAELIRTGFTFGQRHDQTVALAGHLARYGLPVDEILELVLLIHEHRSSGQGRPRQEVARDVISIVQREQQKQRAQS